MQLPFSPSVGCHYHLDARVEQEGLGRVLEVEQLLVRVGARLQQDAPHAPLVVECQT